MPKIMMIKHKGSELLGERLKKAGLVSAAQIQVALADIEYNSSLRIGEVLALRGWLEQQTIDFFADEWQPLIEECQRYPLGYYLVKSGLLTGEQAYLILQEQKQLWIKFGSIAIIQGLITQETLDFFLDSLFPGASSQPPAIGSQSQPENQDETASVEVDYDDIPWID